MKNGKVKNSGCIYLNVNFINNKLIRGILSRYPEDNIPKTGLFKESRSSK